MKTFFFLSIFLNLIFYISSSSDKFITPFEFIYYEKKIYLDNDLTGTGNKLKDVVYLALCKTLKCPYDCCHGPIDQLKCADEVNCKNYKDIAYRLKTVKIIILVLLPYILFSILLGFAKIISYRQPQKYKLFREILNVSYGIIFPPYGICLIIRYFKHKNLDDSFDSTKSSNKMYKNMSVLFGHKEFELEHFKYNHINKDNIDNDVNNILENENVIDQIRSHNENNYERNKDEENYKY